MNAIVLWHGWGMQPQVWDALRARLAQYHLASQAQALPGYAGTVACANAHAQSQAVAMVDLLMQDIAGPVVLCGWSLGALLAMLAAQRHPEKISQLILFGSTPSFVSRHGWLHGVAPALLNAFAVQLTHSPTDTLKSFITLFNQGDQYARRLTRDLTSALPSDKHAPPSLSTLEAGLSLLAELDYRQLAATIQQPCLLLHGQRDGLMPVSAAAWLAQAMPNAQLEILPQAAHAPFLSDPEYCATRMANFLARPAEG